MWNEILFIYAKCSFLYMKFTKRFKVNSLKKVALFIVIDGELLCRFWLAGLLIKGGSGHAHLTVVRRERAPSTHCQSRESRSTGKSSSSPGLSLRQLIIIILIWQIYTYEMTDRRHVLTDVSMFHIRFTLNIYVKRMTSAKAYRYIFRSIYTECIRKYILSVSY